jgi:hypothetical protein
MDSHLCSAHALEMGFQLLGPSCWGFSAHSWFDASWLGNHPDLEDYKRSWTLIDRRVDQALRAPGRLSGPCVDCKAHAETPAPVLVGMSEAEVRTWADEACSQETVTCMDQMPKKDQDGHHQDIPAAGAPCLASDCIVQQGVQLLNQTSGVEVPAQVVLGMGVELPVAAAHMVPAREASAGPSKQSVVTHNPHSPSLGLLVSRAAEAQRHRSLPVAAAFGAVVFAECFASKPWSVCVRRTVAAASRAGMQMRSLYAIGPGVERRRIYWKTQLRAGSLMQGRSPEPAARAAHSLPCVLLLPSCES